MEKGKDEKKSMSAPRLHKGQFYVCDVTSVLRWLLFFTSYQDVVKADTRFLSIIFTGRLRWQD